MQRLFQSHVCSVKCRHEWGPHSLWRQALLRQVGWLMGCEGGVKMGLSSWSDCRWCVWGQGQSSYACRLSVTPCVCVSTCLVSPLCSHVLLVFSVMSPSPLCPLYVFRSLIRVSSPIVTSLFTCLVRVSYSAYFLFYFDSPVFHVRCV